MSKLASILFLCFTFVLPATAQQKSSWAVVASRDCGNEQIESQDFLVRGQSYKFTSSTETENSLLTCDFGTPLIYAFDGMDINAKYRIELVFYSDAKRVVMLSADGNSIDESITIPAHSRVEKNIILPQKSYAYGQLVLHVESLSGPNAVLSEMKIYSDNPKELQPFKTSQKQELNNLKLYTIEENVDVEVALPDYTPIPKAVNSVFVSQLSLNGIWEFCEDESGDKWSPIMVPGQWSMQGFEVDSASTALYRRSFTLPQDWQQKGRVKLRFDAVHSECTLFLNGREVGKHEGGMTAFEFDITDFLIHGENKLHMRICSESRSDMLGSLTQYAAHQLGGITRKVTLFVTPDLYISDTRIITDLDDDYKDAQLRVLVELNNTSTENIDEATVVVNLAEHNFSKSFRLPTLKAGERWSGWLESEIESPRLWDNEHPNLYSLNIELLKDSQILQQNSHRIGFREVVVEGNRLLVNGRAVKLRGVCRHEAHPTMGRAITDELRRKDAQLYMEANCNFVRTSHYPPGEEFIAACDELGLFVEVESPICWMGHHANYNWRQLNYKDSQWYDYVLQANMETIHLYRNHPSIIFWSMANESYWNREFAQVGVYMREADPSRPYAFHDQGYGGFNNQGSDAPIANIHYPGPRGYQENAVKNSARPMVYGEYCHLNVYNRSELVTDPGIRSDWALALAPTWENMYHTDAILGGSIWSGIDDVFQLQDGSAVGYGEWGPIDGWRRPKPEYWDMKKIYSPVKVHTKELSPSKKLIVELENRYTFTNFNELEISYKFADQQGQLIVDLVPGSQSTLMIPIDEPEAANSLYLTFRDPKGFIVDEYIIPVGEQSQNSVDVAVPIKTRLLKRGQRAIIKGENFECVVNMTTGQIVSFVRDGVPSITGGPQLMTLSLMGGGCFPNHNKNTPIHNETCSEWQAKSVRAEETKDGVLIKVNGSYKEAEGEYQMLINASGMLELTYCFTALEDVNPRQVGMVFQAEEEYTITFWRRDGLWSLYPDDHISRTQGEAQLFYDGIPAKIDPRVKPLWSWSKDQNELGSNDFRSTRRNIWYAGLRGESGGRITAISNGEQHWRAWNGEKGINFIVAEFVTAGDELFLGSFNAQYRRPIKTGDEIKGKIMLKME